MGSGRPTIVVERPNSQPGNHASTEVFKTLEDAEGAMREIDQGGPTEGDFRQLQLVWATASYNVGLLRVKYKTDKPLSDFQRNGLKILFNWDDAKVSSDPVNQRCQDLMKRSGAAMDKLRGGGHNRDEVPPALGDDGVARLTDMMSSMGFELIDPLPAASGNRLAVYRRDDIKAIVALTPKGGSVVHYTVHIEKDDGTVLVRATTFPDVDGVASELKSHISVVEREPSRSEYDRLLNAAIDRKDWAEATRLQGKWGDRFYRESTQHRYGHIMRF